jgi:gliding motility-associated-like protein
VLLGNTPVQSGVTYSWSPADGTLSDPSVANPTATPAAPGLYTYTLTASNTGCSTSSEISVTSVGLDLNLDVPDKIFLCKGESGQIRVSVSPAGTPLVWSPFNSLSFVSGDSIALVYPDDNQEYTITASLPGCSRSKKVSVRVDSLPQFLNLSPVDTTVCKGSQVIIRWPESDPLYEPGLFPDMTFQWSPGDYQVTPDSLPFLAVQPQDTVLYRRIAINGACRDTAYANVNATSPPEFVITPLQSTICPDSSVLLTATALTPYDSLRWTPSTSLSCATCEIPLATPAGSTTYTLTAEYNGCKASYNTVVNVKPLPLYQFPDMPSMCSGDEIRLNELSDPAGSVYQWLSVPPLPIPQVPEPTVTLGGIGIQTVKFIMNATNGCLVRDSFSVTYTGVTLTATGSDTICPKTQKTLIASSTLGGGIYLWSNGATTQAILADPAATTTYTVTYTINGCEYKDEVLLVVEGQTPEVVFPDDIALCPGDSIVLNNVATSGATYSWTSTPPVQIDQTGIPSPVVPQQTTQFKVNAVLGDCTVEKTLNVVVLNASLTVTPDLKVCVGQPFTLNATGTSTGTYEWNPGNDEPSITDKIDTQGSVNYALLYTYGPPGNTCQIVDTVNVSTYPEFSVEIIADPDSTLNAGDPIELDANIVPSQILNGFTFSWLENGTTPIGDTQQITYTPETLDTSLYFDVKVTAPSGCMETATFRIRVIQPDVNIPNAFTPNSDDANDTFGLTIVEGKAVTERMEIYSRWGQLVYEDTSPAAVWDGRVDNQDAPSDVYVYRIRWRRGDGSLVISTGQVTLIR